MLIVCLPVGHLLGELQSALHFVLGSSGLFSQVSPSDYHPWREHVLSTKDENRLVECRPA